MSLTESETQANKVLCLDDIEKCVDEIIARVGKDIVFGMPLGLGKPTQLINALYQRACNDSSINLRILSALSLVKPSAGKNPVEKALLEPFIERVYQDCPDLDYMVALSKQQLPPNVEVCEFFFKPGSMLGNATAQRGYISTNYTHAARDVFEQGCNVAAQALASKEIDGKTCYSMSCNPDTTPELVDYMRQAGRDCLLIGQVNNNLPFMVNDALIEADEYDLILDAPGTHTTLFSTPKLSVATPDYMIGMNASALIPDGGTLQIGIGALGDAIVYGCQMRHEHNDTYIDALKNTGVLDQSGPLVDKIGGTGRFDIGLYGATEMFVDGFFHLFKSGILKRRVYDFWALQQLINEKRCDPQNLTADVLEGLESLGVRVIRTKDFDTLKYHGFFNDQTRYDNGHIIAPDGTKVIANVADPEARSVIGKQCLGSTLRNGVVLHGGFFLGPNDFYQGLRDLSAEENNLISMSGVNKINQLDLNPRLYRLQRMNARFINTGILCTMNGAVVSDGLEDSRVISGVGGQYNFVAMAHQMRTGRSILMIRAVREKNGEYSSNIVWNYGHCTIPRHLRDIIITEYGIADLRSKTDGEIMKALLNVTDSRFQSGLLSKAKAAGKIEADYEIPTAYRNNTPERLEAVLKPMREKGLFPDFPFGTDLTDQEITLGRALKGVKARVGDSKLPWRAIVDSRQIKEIPDAAKPYLERVGMDKADDFKAKLGQKLLILELQKAGKL